MTSISTTPEATKAALAAYRGYRLALIAGGHEREQDYAELGSLLAGYGVTTVACLPVTGARLAAATRAAAPHIAVLCASPTSKRRCGSCTPSRRDFDAVILSPGAPSYNQFKNFEERGRTIYRAGASHLRLRPRRNNRVPAAPAERLHLGVGTAPGDTP